MKKKHHLLYDWALTRKYISPQSLKRFDVFLRYDLNARLSLCLIEL